MNGIGDAYLVNFFSSFFCRVMVFSLYLPLWAPVDSSLQTFDVHSLIRDLCSVVGHLNGDAVNALFSIQFPYFPCASTSQLSTSYIRTTNLGYFVVKRIISYYITTSRFQL
jgi:hypothetical protein